MFTETLSPMPLDHALSLRQQLSQFGLNPGDWQVMPLNCDLYCAIHRQDQDLILAGAVAMGPSLRWMDLCLLDNDNL